MFLLSFFRPFVYAAFLSLLCRLYKNARSQAQIMAVSLFICFAASLFLQYEATWQIKTIRFLDPWVLMTLLAMLALSFAPLLVFLFLKLWKKMTWATAFFMILIGEPQMEVAHFVTERKKLATRAFRYLFFYGGLCVPNFFARAMYEGVAGKTESFETWILTLGAYFLALLAVSLGFYGASMAILPKIPIR